MKRQGFLEHCLANPPPRGEDGDREFLMNIKKELVVQDGHGAQIVAVSDRLVAKIFDPLYYPDPTKREECDPHTNISWMPTRAANFHHCNEIETYRALSLLGGKVIPKFYGSFTMDIPYDGHHTRAVRLIILERIHGISMAKAEPILRLLPLKRRQDILKQTIDAESAIFRCDVRHGDTAPRNIMLVGLSGGDGVQVRLLDFGSSRRMLEKDMIEGITRAEHRALSPILRWRRLGSSFAVGGWIDWEYVAWLDETWKDSSAYAPITPRMTEIFMPPPVENSDW